MSDDKDPYERIFGKKKEISKVPAPAPKSNTGGYTPHPIWKKPDWKYWKHKTKIKLWEAAFLCCDIDPRNQDYSDIKTRHYEKINNYLDFLRDNLNLLDFDSLTLPEVAIWAFDKGHEIPKELAVFVKKLDAAPVIKENKQTPIDPIKSIEGKEIRGVPKKEIIKAFRGIHYLSDKNWSKSLASPPDWLKRCRVERGRKGSKTKSALWNPVCIAIELYEKKTSVKKLEQTHFRVISIKDLNNVFKKWEEWKDEWEEKSYHLQPQNI